MKSRTRAKLFLVLTVLALVGASATFLMQHPVKSRPPAPVKEVKQDQAEVVIDGFRYAKTGSDNSEWNLKARTAEMQKSTGLAKLNQLEAVFSAKDGSTLKLTADGGVFDSNTRNIKIARRDKDIVVTSNKGYVMCAEDLNWDDKKKLLTTDNAVTLKGRNIKIEGRGMVANSDLQEVRITNGVKTVFTQGR